MRSKAPINTRQCVYEGTGDDEVTKATGNTCEDPVKRRLMKKTDLRNDDSVMNVDAHLLNVVNTLTNDETVPETNPC